MEHVIKRSLAKNRINRWRTQDRTRRYQLIDQYGSICWYCGFDIPEFKQQTIDHIVPLSILVTQGHGYKTSERPIALACRMCNNAKANLTVDEFAVWINHIRSANFSSILIPAYPSLLQKALLHLTYYLTKFKIFSII